MKKILHLNAVSSYSIYNQLILSVVIIFIILTEIDTMANEKQYTVENRLDGGYTITLTINKRHWKPFTAEGFFPRQRIHFVIEIIGEGKNWSKNKQEGYFYPTEYVISKGKAWDFGYAWIDLEKKTLYLNFFWASAPNDIIPSDVNGKYKLCE